MSKEPHRALTQPMYYILLSLKEPRHGYEIMQYVEELTDKRVKIGPGTLYSILSRFEEEGYIKMVSDTENRKTYVITNIGEQVLDMEIQRLEALLEDAKRILGGGDNEI